MSNTKFLDKREGFTLILIATSVKANKFIYIRIYLIPFSYDAFSFPFFIANIFAYKKYRFSGFKFINY
jgi:hypothetical protein